MSSAKSLIFSAKIEFSSFCFFTFLIAKKVPVKKNKTAKKMKNFAVNLVCLKFICLKNILYPNSSVLNKKKAQKKDLANDFLKSKVLTSLF